MDVIPTSEHGQSVPDGTCDQNDLPGQVDLLCWGPFDLPEGFPLMPFGLLAHANFWHWNHCCNSVSVIHWYHCRFSHVNCASIFVLQNRLHALTANISFDHERGLPSCEAALLCLYIRPDGLAQKP